ncbi:type II toxin-antitoxin system RelE family toxin [Halococcoides cellulosivorans]|uniref:Plasmid stabilization protein n=1 Tax=Halococcoides cellulosivorans TaxID=1679096 RepID=A0A2R4X232_9EURY|nr:type II toxin-antitoxin system RelE/ParE family toxin [Halococcoides cellulosivorans]AWB27825.1 plasmid stabilization protein [Halococcoides cellulosivorans]
MSYTVLLAEQPRSVLDDADDKTDRIVRDNLQKLADDPYPRPNAGRGDREKLTVDGRSMYRLHIGRSYTAFYTIDDGETAVRVREILPIDEAHRRYGT